eukprot:TRINITY_DN1458_c0_g1_i1.p1 TRINITY_DN1458_c0_g1~~TRINITY_DN1458_c0_g1_i1.p1  ORF type:complete len:466 (-),score=32.84 TRINITY_DN1458_c0_g1_i1:167-1564(-)
MEMSNESACVLALPKDVWSVIFENIDLYDSIFLRMTSKWFNKACKEFKPFPQFHVLDQDHLMLYLIENGSISCLDYVKHTLHFEWTSELCSIAARCGRIDVLQHLRSHGCPFNEHTVLSHCTQGTCSLAMIKYLHESGVSWRQTYPTSEFDQSDYNLVADMASNGHIDCIKYAMENGYDCRKTYYVPSIECLDFLIENDFDWKGDVIQGGFFARIAISRLNICEEAATRGDIKMLRYAHQNGAPLGVSAARATNLDCLVYAVEHNKGQPLDFEISTVECCKYLVEKFGYETMRNKLVFLGQGSKNVEYLQYLFAIGIPLPDSSFSLRMVLSRVAASADALKLMLNHVPPELISAELYADCARCGNFDSFKVVCERNIPLVSSPFDSISGFQRIILNAIHAKSFDIVKFAWEKFPNKERFDMDRCALEAVGRATPEILEFLTQHGAIWNSKHLEEAADSGNLPALA